MAKIIENHNTNSGLGFTGALTILFIALKLLGFIAWSWWWVLSPIWISILVFLIAACIAIAVAVKYVK